jgi:hypothetical protein
MDPPSSRTAIRALIMQLLILWCEAHAAQERLRNEFKESSEPDKELASDSSMKAETRKSHGLASEQKSTKEFPRSQSRVWSAKTNLPPLNRSV